MTYKLYLTEKLCKLNKNIILNYLLIIIDNINIGQKAPTKLIATNIIV